MSSVLARFDALDRLLVEKGFPATSPWWRATLGRFYASACRQLVLRVGRRGGKSSTLCRIAVVVALYGEHVIPPGDLGIVGIVSVTREEAGSRLRTIKAILDVLRIQYRPIDSGIELVDRPIAFKVHAATVGGVVGGTWICAICDEVSRWRDTESGTNPAREVLSSLRPSLATQGNARIFLSSSPLSVEDAHARAFDDGDDGFQLVGHAPTWTANPSITESETHALEKDPKVWAREYAAEPQQAVSAAFEADLVRAAIRPGGAFTAYPPPILLLDSSAGKGDSFTWAAAQLFTENGRERIRIGHASAFDGKFHRTMTSDQVIEHIATTARAKLNVTLACGDGFNGFFIVSALAKKGIRYETLTWSADTKAEAVARVRRWLRDGDLYIEPGEEAERLRLEMIGFRERMLSSGVTSYGARNGGHDDRVALLLNLAMAETEGLFSHDVAPIVSSPIMMGASATGFEGVDAPSVVTGPSAGRHTTPGRAADTIVQEALRRDATTNASTTDSQPLFGSAVAHVDPLEGF